MLLVDQEPQSITGFIVRVRYPISLMCADSEHGTSSYDHDEVLFTSRARSTSHRMITSRK